MPARDQPTKVMTMRAMAAAAATSQNVSPCGPFPTGVSRGCPLHRPRVSRIHERVQHAALEAFTKWAFGHMPIPLRPWSRFGSAFSP